MRKVYIGQIEKKYFQMGKRNQNNNYAQSLWKA